MTVSTKNLEASPTGGNSLEVPFKILVLYSASTTKLSLPDLVKHAYNDVPNWLVVLVLNFHSAASQNLLRHFPFFRSGTFAQSKAGSVSLRTSQYVGGQSATKDVSVALPQRPT